MHFQVHYIHFTYKEAETQLPAQGPDSEGLG